MRYLCIVAVFTLAGGAGADFLLWDNGPFDDTNALSNGKGEDTIFGKVWIEAADDFQAGDPGWRISGGHFEGLHFYSGLQIDYIMVRFYLDNNGLPFEDPFYAEDSCDFTVNEWFNSDWGYYQADIDVNFGPVAVPPGIYWAQFTPYGLYGDWFYQGCTTNQWGSYAATRSPWDYYDREWRHFDWPLELSFQLTGYVIPEPAAFTALAGMVLGLGGILWRRK